MSELVYISNYHNFAVIEREDPGSGWTLHTVKEVKATFGQEDWPVKMICRGRGSLQRAIDKCEQLELSAMEAEEKELGQKKPPEPPPEEKAPDWVQETCQCGNVITPPPGISLMDVDIGGKRWCAPENCSLPGAGASRAIWGD